LTPDIPQKLIRKVHRASYPSRLICLDSETKQTKIDKAVLHDMQICWTAFVDLREQAGFDNPAWSLWKNTFALCSYLHKKAYDKTVLYLFGHNIFFDLQVCDFYYLFTLWGWQLDFIYDKGLTYILSVTKDKKKIYALSTTNFFETSLKKLGDMLGLPKLDVDFETVSEPDLIKYCKRDTEILVKALQSYIGFLQSNDLGKFCFTKSSQALHAYRHRFMQSKIYVHNWESGVSVERSSYFGGRTEAFHLGKVKGGPFVSLDVNSMYPYVMRNKRMPTRLVDYRDECEVSDVKWMLQKFCLIARCRLDTDQALYAKRYNGKCCFPVGRFETTLCTEGIHYALSRGHLVSLTDVCIYEQGFIFKDYVDFFHGLKIRFTKERNDIWVYLIKKNLNSLYGKFGQKMSVTTEREDMTCDGYYRIDVYDLETGEKGIEYKLFNKVVTEMGCKEGANTLVAIASHITEYARIYLWTLMERIGVKNVLYCDTDSIKFRRKYLPMLRDKLDRYELGKLKLEETFSLFKIFGLKSYRCDALVKMKGVPQKAKKVGPYKYKYQSFLNQSSHMRQEEMRHAIMVEVKKVTLPYYDKGIVSPDGRISPFELSEF